MARQIIGLDIGSYSIKVVRLTVRGRSQADWTCESDQEKILWGDAPHDSVQGREAELKALRALQSRGILLGQVFISALPNQQAQARFLNVPFTNSKKIEAVLGGILESQIPFNLEKLVYPWTRLGTIPKQVSAHTEILAGFAPKTTVKHHLDLLQTVAILPKIVNFKALALFELNPAKSRSITDAEQPPKSEPCYAIIDIGHESTSVCIMAENRVVQARVIRRGVRDICDDTAASLDIESTQVNELILSGNGLGATPSTSTSNEKAWREALWRAVIPLARDLKQSVLGIKTHGNYEIQECYLVGGGAKIPLLGESLSEYLGVAILPAGKLPHSNSVLKSDSSFALAMSLALQGLTLSEKINRLNFRHGDFSFSDQQIIFKGKMPALIGWGVAIFSVLFINFTTQKVLLNKEIASVVSKQQELCNAVVSGKAMSPSKCLAFMKKELSGTKNISVAKFSAVNPYLELSSVLPQNTSLKITDLEISRNALKVQGTTASFENVDKIVDGLKTGRCFTDVKKGKATMLGDQVSFVITLTLNCEGVLQAGGGTL